MPGFYINCLWSCWRNLIPCLLLCITGFFYFSFKTYHWLIYACFISQYFFCATFSHHSILCVVSWNNRGACDGDWRWWQWQEETEQSIFWEGQPGRTPVWVHYVSVLFSLHAFKHFLRTWSLLQTKHTSLGIWFCFQLIVVLKSFWKLFPLFFCC